MIKINNIRDIQIEKMRLRIKQLEQEKTLNSKWIDFKKNFNPDLFIEQKIAEIKNKESFTDFLITHGLGIGAGFLTKKLNEFTGRRIGNFIDKGVGKLAKKLNVGIQNKT